MYAKHAGKPLWKLIVDFTPEEYVPPLKIKKKKLTVKKRFVKATSFRYITDALTPAEALDILKSKESGKAAREAEVKKRGYPAYTTSVGWLGYSDEKVRRLTKESLAQGFNHFKVSILLCHMGHDRLFLTSLFLYFFSSKSAPTLKMIFDEDDSSDPSLTIPPTCPKIENLSIPPRSPTRMPAPQAVY